MDDNSQTNLSALTTIVAALAPLSREEQQRTLQAVAVFLGVTWESGQKQNSNGFGSPPAQSSQTPLNAASSFSEDRAISAKEFLRDKKPSSDVEKVACLGYFLSHYRETPHFKTLEISTLNTEAAQPKFSNASMAVENATKAGLLVPALKGSKQLSSAGEHYVQLLPDREAAREAMKATKIRRKQRRGIPKKTVAAVGSAND